MWVVRCIGRLGPYDTDQDLVGQYFCRDRSKPMLVSDPECWTRDLSQARQFDDDWARGTPHRQAGRGWEVVPLFKAMMDEAIKRQELRGVTTQ